LGGLKQRSTSDAGVTLTHFICSGWTKNNITSTLAFDITQFFPSINHRLLPLIMKKAGCHSRVVQFFSNYLIDRKTWYCWNNFSSFFFNIDIGIGQGSALSSILSALYISLVFHILEKCLKNLEIPVSILSFINDGLFIVQSKSLTVSNSLFFCSYNVISSILDKFSLILEYGKTEVFHFSRAQEVFNPSPLDLSAIGGPILKPKDI